MYMNDVMTVPSSLAGLPAMSVPVGYSRGDGGDVPVGLHIIGQRWREMDVARVAAALEDAALFVPRSRPLSLV
jgi:aspartyl-tRNA(Asn)/glutamyl-tRNA(Gln) amidotransferase subunit A